MGSQKSPNSDELIEEFLSKSEKEWRENGLALVQDVYSTALTQTKAYSMFLETSGKSSVDEVQSLEDYTKVPLTTKENYYDVYNLQELARNGNFAENYLICTSSGSSGKPHYWPRYKDQDSDEPSMIEVMYSFLGVKERSTLIISCLALGTWVAANIMNDSSLEIARKDGVKITVITPGPHPSQILDIVRDLGKFYDQILLIGYPPTIRTVIIDGIEDCITWSDYSPKLIVGGEPVSQYWKDFILDKIGSNNLTDIGVVFGMAEMHLVSFETPLAAAIREELYKRPEVSDKLFGTTTLGALLQFNPSLRWIEEEHGELIITAKTGIPLVRYNSHDLGGVMGFSELLGKLSDEGIVVGDLLNKLNLTLEDAWKWPFFFCHGRGNSVSLMGANIYPANVEKFFQSHHIIHDYKLEVIHSEEQEPRLAVHVELRKNSSVTQLEEKIFCEMAETEILELLLQNNADYADAYSEEPSAMSPLVILYTYSAGPFEQKQMKQHHIVH